MESIGQCRELAMRIRSFFEINLDFYFFNDNVFHLGKKNLLPIYKIVADEDDYRRHTIGIGEKTERSAGKGKSGGKGKHSAAA